jgi:hypothetical protein
VLGCVPGFKVKKSALVQSFILSLLTMPVSAARADTETQGGCAFCSGVSMTSSHVRCQQQLQRYTTVRSAQAIVCRDIAGPTGRAVFARQR